LTFHFATGLALGDPCLALSSRSSALIHGLADLALGRGGDSVACLKAVLTVDSSEARDIEVSLSSEISMAGGFLSRFGEESQERTLVMAGLDRPSTFS